MAVMQLGPDSRPPGRAAAVRIVDSSLDGVHSGVAIAEGKLLAFVGYLDAPEQLRLRLGMNGDASPAALVLTAIDNWGDQAFSRLTGEWSLALIDSGSARVTLANSPNLRDPLFFASDGRRVAIAPSMALLSELDWVGGEFAALPLLQSMSSWVFRRELGNRTWLDKVDCVDRGTFAEITAAGSRQVLYHMPAPEAPWKGDFVDAIAELETRCRRTVAAHLRRHGDVAVLLSGGLDSSTLAWLVATELAPGQKATAVTSVKPATGSFTDESEFARLAASHLGLPLIEVNPGVGPGIYRPSCRTLAFREMPTAGPRHYLYEALYEAASATGATAVFDGQLGERSVTRSGQKLTPLSLTRSIIGDFRSRRARTINEPDWPAAGMQVMPSTHALAVMTSVYGTASRQLPREALRWPGQSMGMPRGAEKQGRITSATPGLPLRSILAFRDLALLTFVARLPDKYTRATGLPRSLARALIAGHMPEKIVRRTSKAPFAPDYYHRLRVEAAAARQRIAVHRRNGADEWLDLDWLESHLERIGTQQISPWTAFRIQETATAAEFVTWWRAERRGPA